MATSTKAAPSRRKKAPPRRKKSAPSRAKSAQPRVISKSAIIVILTQLLDPHGIYPVVLKAPIGDYIRGDRGALRAFFAVANRAFARYGLNLKPGNLANVKTVQDLVDVIADWLGKHGYQVTS
jgi:hypothetical protein